MAKARCILCGSELVGKTCPKCSVGAAGDPMRIDRDTDKSRPAARRRAPAPQPPGPATVDAMPAADFEGETDKVAPLEMPPPRRSKPSAAPKPAPEPEPEPEPEDAAEPPPAEMPRSKTEEKKSWYALAGMERPPELPSAHGQDDGLLPPVSTKEDELRGYHPAAIIFAATGLASFAIAATGQMPDVAAGVGNLIAAGALFKHYSWAKFLAIAFGALHIGKMALGLALTGSSVFVVAMLPPVCVIAAFVLDEARWRAAAAGVGVALAFSWVAVYAFRPAPSARADPMDEFAIEGGKWADEKFGLNLAAPAGIALIDAKKAADSVKDEQGGLIGLFLKKAAKKRPTTDRLLIKGTEVDVDGSLKLVTLPPKVTTASMLLPIFGEESKPIRDDDLVPRKIRETEGLTTEGWREYSRRVVLIRAADGRLVTAVCNANAAGADHLCQGYFAGLSLKPSMK
ncbi:MAG TPA: hypothetical protein VGK67_38205 [Myxococcales bacterium]|jgi:hypothetical protein